MKLIAAINPATGGPGLKYEGAFVPPTLRANPGDTLNITYSNQLPVSDNAPFNDASIHFHGLSTSPNPPADDSIGMFAMPGQTLHYVVPIPRTQPPGLYWYHSHAPGESNWQILNGMSGAIVVNGVASFVPQTAGLAERIIVLRNVLAQPSYKATTNAIYAHTEHATSDAALADGSSGGVCSQPWDIPSEYTSINGTPVGNAQIEVPSGERQVWRVLNASADGFYDLSVPGRTLQLISVDGVPLRTYPGGRERKVTHYMIPPAGRATFIVTGSAGGSILRTVCTNTGPAGDPNPPQTLARVVGAGHLAELPMIPTPGATPPARGTYEELVGEPVRQRSVAFTENSHGFYLNGQQYSMTGPPIFTVKSGTVERWTLINSTHELHVFHSHQVHFIVEDVDGVRQPRYWHDTINLPYESQGEPGIVHVVMDFRDPEIKGTFLFHCHIEQHADQGMMAKVTVR